MCFLHLQPRSVFAGTNAQEAHIRDAIYAMLVKRGFMVDE